MSRISSLLILTSVVIACAPEGSHEGRRDRAPTVAVFPVEIATPRVLEGLPLGPLDHSGRPSVTPCRTCHGADAGVLPETAQEVQGPHAGLRVQHGTLRCASCHEASARDKLHLADGRIIALTDAMVLCAQCHGTQKRDYDHGAHGGMRGYWDLSRGPRERNHCVSCHDPHAPKFGVFMPVSATHDRFVDDHEGDSRD